MGNVIFNGLSSLDYGIQVEHPPGYQIPAKNYTVSAVPGRSGDIVVWDGSYKNVNRQYEIAVADLDKDFTEMANAISEWLNSSDGYARLEDTYEPDYYRLAYYDEEATIENILSHAGRVTVNFNCKPQRYLKSGEIPIKITKPVELINPTNYASNPIITVYGNGEESTNLTIGNRTFAIDLTKGPITIDCDLKDVYYDGENRNDCIKIEKGFPTLGKGTTTISWDSGELLLEVIPRWWTI